MCDVLNFITQNRIVIIYRGLSPEQCLQASKVLMEAGIVSFEVTMNSPDALSSIRLLKREIGSSARIGAGTVTNVRQVEEVAEAGATYIISPNVNQAVIQRTKQLGLVSIPGAMTPSEIAFAQESGADMVKLFPINVLGSQFLRQVKGPFGDEISFMPSGGITFEMVSELFEAGAAALGIGVQLLGVGLIEKQDWKELKTSAKRFLDSAFVYNPSNGEA